MASLKLFLFVMLDFLYAFGYLLLCISPLIAVTFLQDLKSDRMNGKEFCSQMKSVIIVDYVVHGILAFLIFISKEYVFFLIQVPIIAFHIYKVYKKNYLYDPLQIRRTDVINAELKKSYTKLGLYVFLGVYSMVRFIFLLLLLLLFLFFLF